MIENTYSIKKPNANDSKLYENFCELYSFLEISTTINSTLLQNSSSKDIDILIDEALNKDHHDLEFMHNLFLGMGLEYKSGLNKNDSRGLVTNIFNQKDSSKESLVNLLLMQKFMLLYSITEDNIKKFLVNNSSKFKNKSMITQENIFEELFYYLEQIEEADILEAINKKSTSLFKNKKDISLIWKYYTRLRNLYVHSAGKVTQDFKNDISGLKPKLEDLFSQEKWIYIVLLVEDEEMILDFDFEKDRIYFFKQHQLNFFRNFIILLFESINEVLINE